MTEIERGWDGGGWLASIFEIESVESGIESCARGLELVRLHGEGVVVGDRVGEREAKADGQGCPAIIELGRQCRQIKRRRFRELRETLARR